MPSYLVEGGQFNAVNELRKESPELTYALEPFLERTLPAIMRVTGKALRDHYGFRDDVLGFFDLHTYIDIYHERFGAYIMAKYAKSRRIQEIFQTALETRRKNGSKRFRAVYDVLFKK